MAAQTSLLVRDNSTLANFKQWAQGISNFMATAGWLQTADTGQVNWSTIVSVPTAGNYVYENWKTNDGLTTIYLKIEYGTNSGSSNTGSQTRWTFSTATNGSGQATGIIDGPYTMPGNGQNITSTTSQWACNFSGDAGRIAILMWRTETYYTGNDSATLFIAMQRSKNSSGVDTNSYFTVVATSGAQGFNTGWSQRSTYLSGGTITWQNFGNSNNNGATMFNTAIPPNGTLSANGIIGVKPIAPYVGFDDNPMDNVLIGGTSDFKEGAIITIPAANMPYGVSHTYIVSASVNTNGFYHGRIGNGSWLGCLLMRYD